VFTDLRVGIGVDVHRYDSATPLMLATLAWPDEPGLVGHSDGDVAAHAACDALFAAAGMGDLGSNFGVAEPELAGASGSRLLAETATRLRAAGHSPQNISIQIIGNHPRFAPRREEACESMSLAVGCHVHVSATTSDGLGLTGRGEGLAAIATALVAIRAA
jgi:2-C-methyl-D-erythritol 2,4-cyclodiphosphate synthase